MFLPATDADLLAIAALMNHAWRGAGGAAGWSNETACLAGDRASAAMLREELAASPAASLLKWVEPGDDTPRGCVRLEPWATPPGTSARWRSTPAARTPAGAACCSRPRSAGRASAGPRACA